LAPHWGVCTVERAYWQDFITHLQEMTGKRLKGRLGGGAGYTASLVWPV
jgi:hypothetical protein